MEPYAVLAIAPRWYIQASYTGEQIPKDVGSLDFEWNYDKPLVQFFQNALPVAGSSGKTSWSSGGRVLHVYVNVSNAALRYCISPSLMHLTLFYDLSSQLLVSEVKSHEHGTFLVISENMTNADDILFLFLCSIVGSLYTGK